MDIRRPHDEVIREPFDPRDVEISRLKREVAALRGREESARTEAQDARKHFADLTSMSKRFAHSMRATVGERQQQRRHLAAQYAISQVLATACDLDDAAPRIYEILGEHLGWHAGILWKVDYDSGPPVLRRAGCWRSGGSPSGALEEASNGMAFRHGEGLPGKVWERGEPVWVEDVLADGNMPRKTAAAEDGLRGALAFPIVDGRFVGVFELFHPEVLPPDEDLMRTAALVGGQISLFLEHRHAEEERDLALAREREARERVSGILESINDAFFTLDAERRFTYVNNKAERFWDKTREELLGNGIWEMFPEAVGTEPHLTIEKALREGEAGEFEMVSPLIGTWISVRVYPSPGGVSVLFHSIEERKRAEEAAAGQARLRALQTDIRAEFSRGGVSMSGILHRCAESMVEHLGAAFARVWLFDEGEEMLNLRASAGDYHLDGPYGRIDFGDLKIGHIARNRRPHLTNEVQDEPHVEDGEWARREGMVAFAGYPLVAEGRLMGVAAVFARHELTDEALTTMASVSDAIAQGVAREQAEEALRRSRGRAVFRTTLADALRPLGDPVEIQAEAAAALGRHLGASRVHYAEITEDGEHVKIGRDYADGVPDLTGRSKMKDFGSALIEEFRAGRPLVMTDVAGSADLSEAERAAYASASVGAQVVMPIVKAGRLVATLSVHQSVIRKWAQDEVALMQETAQRTWDTVERARAEEALRESEERYRSLFQSIDEGFCTVEVLFDKDGRPFDYRFRETNLAFAKQTGLKEVAGKTARELVPGLEDRWFEACRRVALTGEHVRFENRVESLDGWFDVYAYPVGRPQSRTIGILFRDVTRRRLAEEALRESEERLQRAIAIQTVGVIFFKPEGDIFEANDAFLNMSGYDREDLAAGLARWDTMTPPEHMPRSLQAIEEFQSTGRSTPYEKEYVRKDGSRWWGLFAATRLNDGEGAEFIIDITETKRAEEALRHSEERFRAIADLVPDLLWSNDASGAASWYNRRWFEYTGLNIGESKEYGWLYSVHPDDREASVQAFLAAIDSGQPLRLEHRIRGRDKAYRWFLVQANPLCDDEGRIARWFGAATDIDEQRTALEALGESEVRYRSLTESSSSIVWTSDKTGAIVEEIPAWEEFTGQTYREYRGFGWIEALHPEDRPPDTLWEELVASDPAPMEEEYRLRHRDGGYRRVVMRGIPIIDKGGETREWVGTIFDVEDNRRAAEEREDLRRETERERARLQTILQQMPGGVFIADASGRFVLTNEGGKRIYGRNIGSVEECIRHSRSYPDGGELPPERDPLARALRGEAVTDIRCYTVRPDGTHRVVRVNSAPVRDEGGNVVAAVKAFDDVTERVRAEEERDRMRGREQKAHEQVEEAERRLAYYAGAREERQVISRELHDRVAHSIAVVRQNLELYEVLRDRNPEAAAKKMELAKAEAKASLKSTRDLSMMLRRSEVEEGITKALASLEETTVPMGIHYESTIRGDESLVPPHVGNQIFLVLREAVRNAVSHSDCEHVTVGMDITKERVIGTVEDDGQGFEPDEVRANGGLRSMEERASLVGGEFRLSSAPGGGAKIEVCVRLTGEGTR